MKQVFQNVKQGITEVLEVPAPSFTPGMVTIQSSRTLISAGTERMLVEFGQKSLIGKARSQPDKVKQVLSKMKAEGVLPTLETVFSVLGEPMPIGYCQMGRIVAIGEGVQGFRLNQRVISNGQHAEFVSVPENLCAAVPDQVPDDEAVFTVIGSIALQGIRLASPRIGETIFVSGLGLIGLITVQILRANGCQVIGADFNKERVELARQLGCVAVDLSAGEDPVLKAMAMTDGQGVDAVLITASTPSNDPVTQAANMSRKRGKIVLVGVTGLQLDRRLFYAKELSFQVSCSYGPGRYDPEYEDKGNDYPFGFVRWTEKRNFQAILQLMASKQLDVTPLISRAFDVDDAPEAYRQVLENPSALGVLLKYENAQFDSPLTRTVVHHSLEPVGPSFAIQGAGNFTKRTMLPALKKINWLPSVICSAGGQSAANAAKSFSVQRSTTEMASILCDETIKTVFITTRHNDHPNQIIDALEAGKHVFVEKPLAIDMAGLKKIHQCYTPLAETTMLVVGFNRRFAPHIQVMRRHIKPRSGPLCLNYNVNAGAVPSSHWVLDPLVGGGRLVGEGCHFIDLFLYLAGSPALEVYCTHVENASDGVQLDKTSIVVKTLDGSIGTINYWANGASSFPKEQCHAFFDGKTLCMDNYRQTQGYQVPGFKDFKTKGISKGHAEQFALIKEYLEDGGTPPVTYEEILDSTLVTLAAVQSAKTGQVQLLQDFYRELENEE